MTKKHVDSNQKTAQVEKLSKVRMTGMAAANAVGDKIPMLVTGKAQKPRCFKNVKFYLADIDIKKKLDGWGTV